MGVAIYFTVYDIIVKPEQHRLLNYNWKSVQIVSATDSHDRDRENYASCFWKNTALRNILQERSSVHRAASELVYKDYFSFSRSTYKTVFYYKLCDL